MGRMTEAERHAADAAYAALPGTATNGWTFISASEMQDAGDAFSGLVAEHADMHGSKHIRMTKVDGGLWIEHWDERPAKEADFNPPNAVPTTPSEGK